MKKLLIFMMLCGAAFAQNNARFTSVVVSGATTTSTMSSTTEFIKSGPVCDVKAWGALGDGSNDDTAAINSAITSCATSKGYVYFPPSSNYYRVVPATTGVDEDGTDGLKYAFPIVSNEHIECAKGATIKIADNQSTDGSPRNLALWFTNGVASNISFHNCVFDMNAAHNTISPLRASGTYRFYPFAPIFVSGTPGGVGAHLSDVWVDSNIFQNTPGVSFIVMQQSNTPNVALSTRWKVTNNSFINGGLDTPDHSSVFAWADDVVFVGNSCFSSVYYGVTGAGTGTVGGNVCYEAHGSNQTILGNTITNYYQGFWLANNYSDISVQAVNIGNNYCHTEYVCISAFRNPLLNVTVTSVQITTNVATLQGTNTFSPGDTVDLAGFVGASFLNNQQVTLTAATGSSFTFAFTHANYGPTSESGALAGHPTPLILGASMHNNFCYFDDVHITALGTAPKQCYIVAPVLAVQDFTISDNYGFSQSAAVGSQLVAVSSAAFTNNVTQNISIKNNYGSGFANGISVGATGPNRLGYVNVQGNEINNVVGAGVLATAIGVVIDGTNLISSIVIDDNKIIGSTLGVLVNNGTITSLVTGGQYYVGVTTPYTEAGITVTSHLSVYTTAPSHIHMAQNSSVCSTVGTNSQCDTTLTIADLAGNAFTMPDTNYVPSCSWGTGTNQLFGPEIVSKTTTTFVVRLKSPQAASTATNIYCSVLGQ